MAEKLTFLEATTKVGLELRELGYFEKYEDAVRLGTLADVANNLHDDELL